MGGFEEHKPTLAMIGLQFCYAGVALSTRVSLLQGTSPSALIVYRQAIATLVIAPIAYFSRRKSGGFSLDLRSFTLIFMSSLIGVTLNQNLFFEGLYLASSSMASAMQNIIPAVTFLLATIVGLEEVNTRSIRSLAKILGTVFCVAGAVAMSFLRGPKLLNAESSILPAANSLLGSNSGTESYWLLGCLFLFASTCCWSIWLILQVPVSASYPDHLSLSAWLCFFSTIQSAVVTFFMEKDMNAWILDSYFDIATSFYTGPIASGLAFFVQAWCVEQRGPLYPALFSPLCTIIVTLFAAVFLHEEIYTGSIMGGLAVIIGLYIVLWGKSKEVKEIDENIDPKLNDYQTPDVNTSIDEYSTKTNYHKIDLEEPLLLEDTVEVYESESKKEQRV